MWENGEGSFIWIRALLFLLDVALAFVDIGRGSSGASLWSGNSARIRSPRLIATGQFRDDSATASLSNRCAIWLSSNFSTSLRMPSVALRSASSTLDQLLL